MFHTSFILTSYHEKKLAREGIETQPTYKNLLSVLL